jgi:hypothetical protein
MEKAITLRGGQLYCHKYWQHLLDKIADGTIDLTPWITHQAPLNDAAEAYKIFDEKDDNMLKVRTTRAATATAEHSNGARAGSSPESSVFHVVFFLLLPTSASS